VQAPFTNVQVGRKLQGFTFSTSVEVSKAGSKKGVSIEVSRLCMAITMLR
jgi:hypothetical protein